MACCHVCLGWLAAESRSVKAINCSWCSVRWTQEDSYPSGLYFMVRVHYVQHSGEIHHSAMEDLSFWSLENISECMCVCVCVTVCAWMWVDTAVTVASHVMSPLSTVYSRNALIEVTFHVAVRKTYPNFSLYSLHFFFLLWGFKLIIVGFTFVRTTFEF